MSRWVPGAVAGAGAVSVSLQHQAPGVATLLEVPCLSGAGAGVGEGGLEIFWDINIKLSGKF